jgi:hypothetical protein
MTTPINTQPSPFTDPNNALREFNAYFGSLRKDYGEDAIRAMGFTPRDLAALQASLRKLQMDPTATPEQHRQAYMQARDTLAQRITTPLASTRSYAQVQGLGQSTPQSVTASDGTVVEVARPNLPMATPTQEQLYEYARGVAKGQQSQWDPRIGKFVPVPAEAAASPFAVTPEVEVRGVRPPDGVGAPPTMPETVRPVMPETARPVMPEMAVRPEMPDTRALEAEKAAAERAAEAAIPRHVDPGPRTPAPSASDYIANANRIPPLGRPPKRQEQPTAEQLAAHQQALIDGQPFGTISGYWDPQIGAFRYKSAPRDAVTPVAPVPSATDYISSMVTPPKPAELPMPPVGSPALLGNAPRPVDPSMVQPTAPGILPGIMPMQPAAPSMNTQPGADFDRNVARRIFDAEFRTLREKYGDQGLRAAGFTPRTLASLQAPLTNVQKDNTISYDQSSAALEDALQKLRGYNFGGAQPAAPMQPAAPAPSMGGILGGLLPTPPTNAVNNSNFMVGDPNFRFGQTPQAPNPNAQGMAMGGLINKYYR